MIYAETADKTKRETGGAFSTPASGFAPVQLARLQASTFLDAIY
jgi:hypothetical protein